MLLRDCLESICPVSLDLFVPVFGGRSHPIGLDSAFNVLRDRPKNLGAILEQLLSRLSLRSEGCGEDGSACAHAPSHFVSAAKLIGR
jgi:hypothetical protein